MTRLEVIQQEANGDTKHELQLLEHEYSEGMCDFQMFIRMSELFRKRGKINEACDVLTHAVAILKKETIL